MILHSTLPFRQDIPNPALGYLKGFLQARGFSVQNVYWNLVLARALMDLHRTLEKYIKDTGVSSIPSITLFLCRNLLSNPKKTRTTLDLVYSSAVPEREISSMVSSFRSQIDQHIEQYNLYKTPVAGFTLKTYQWPLSLYIIDRLKELNPDISIVVGGITTEGQAHHFLKILTHADFAIWGEGEYPLFHLLRAMKEDEDFDNVPNLVYRDKNKTTLLSTEKTSEYPDLDSYPFADHSDYFMSFKRFIPVQMPILIPIWGSRSCPWNKCKFCVLNEEYHYRTRSPESILEEIEVHHKKHNIDSFIFVDTELPGNRKRFKKLLRMLIESSITRKRPYHFFAEISPVFIDEETARMMQLASFSSIQIGFEAMTDTLLEKMQKRHRFAHNIQALKLGNKYDLKITGVNIIKDIPPETGEDVKESCDNLEFLRFLLKRYPLSLIFLMLFKDSLFYSEVSEEDRKFWNEDLFWEEIAPTDLVSESDRFELFGFCKSSPTHHHLWNAFENVMMSYAQQNRSYKWMEYPDGSFVEEKGPKILRYTFDRDETDILIFCDKIRTFSEVKKKFTHLSEDNLRKILHSLKEAGMLYYDKDCNTIISVLEAAKRNLVEHFT